MKGTPDPRQTRSEQIQHDFRRLSTISFTTLVMGTWELLLTASSASLLNGGLAGLVWSMIWAYTGQFFLVLSLAEMSSMVPFAGGQYHWAYEFAPRRVREFSSYCCGWLCSIGWQARFVGDCYIIAGIVKGLIIVNNHSYQATQWHHNLLTILAALAVSAFNALAAGHLSLAEGFFAITHVLALVPIVVSLWVLAPKNSARRVFSEFTDNSGGWPSVVLSALVGQSSSFFIVLGSDAVAHISEEILEPDVIVPQCMHWSFLCSIPLSLITLVTYAFNAGSVDLAAKDPLPPFIYMFREAFNSTQATTAFSVVVLSLMVMVAVSTMVSTSRHLFAFGRDRALHVPEWLSEVHSTLQVPVNTILSTIFFTIVICLVTVNNQAVERTILNLSTMSLHATYMATIGFLVRKRLRHETLPYARWSLGRAGLGINIIGVVYSAWAFFWAAWPRFYHVTAEKFNWAVVMFLGSLALVSILFAMGTRRRKKRHQRSVASTYALQGSMPRSQ